MAGKTMQFTATFNDQVSKGIDQITKGLVTLTQRVKEQGEQQAANAKKAADQIIAEDDRVQKQKEKSIALLARLEYDASRAQADILTNRWERLRAIEDAAHKLRLARFKGNDEAIELENQRHTSKLEAITAQQGNFSNTPFQQLLSRIGNLADKVGVPKEVTEGIAKFSEMAKEGGERAEGLAGGLEGVGMGATKILGSLAAVVSAAAAMGEGIKFAYEQARESMDADNRLAAVLRSTGGAAGLAMEQLKGMADALQENTDFSADTVKGAEAVLLRYDALGKDVFPRALKAAADLASGNGDLAGSAEQLGRALQRPQDASRELRTMGIALSETQKKQLEMWALSGEKAKAQAFILDEVARKWGGQAEAMSHATTKLGHQIGELAETIGTPLVKAVDAAAGAILGLMKAQAPERVNDFYAAQLKGLSGLDLKAKQVAESVKAATQAPAAATKPSALDDDAKEKLLQMTFELQKAQTELMQNETDKRRALENIDFEQRKHALGGFTQAIEIETKAHKARLRAIEMESQEAALEDQANAVLQVFKTQQKQEFEAAKRAREDRDRALAEDEKNTQLIYAARDRLAEVSAKTDMDRLKLKQEQELRLYKEGSEARKIIEQAQAKERERLRQQDLQAEIAAGATMVNNIGAALQAMAGKNKTLAKAGLRISEAGAIASTAAGIMKAYEQGGVLGFLTGAAIAAQGVAQVATIEQQIGKLAVGTDYARGGAYLVGEQGPEMVYLPRGAQVKTASETSRMMGATLTPTINIHMAPGTTAADAKAIGDTVDARLRSLMRDVEEAKYRGIWKA